MQKDKLFSLIKNRRSVFPPQYTNQHISKEALEQILESANWAPTHKMTEPWRFKVVLNDQKSKLGEFLAETYIAMTDPEKVKSIKVKKIKENCKNSQAIITICMQRDPKERVPEWEEIAATAMAVQNMWLMCHSMGIGAYWSSPGMIKKAGEFFNLAKGEECLGFFFMGHYQASEVQTSRRDPIIAKVDWLK